MSDAESQRLNEINTQLIQLYLRLDEADSQEKSVWTEINRLEAEKEGLPHTTVYSDRAQQYVTILRSTASSVQLQRQSLQQFLSKPDSKLQPDEIRQKNILLNKQKAGEKKVMSYRQKLTDMGLLPFEVDDIVLEGYREQNQRYLQQMLRGLQSAVEDYLAEHFEQHGTLPDDFFKLMATWEEPDIRQTLTSDALRVLELRSDCVRNGVPPEEIEQMIRSVTQWDTAKKQAKLNQLTTLLQKEIDTLEARQEFAPLVREWISAHIQNERLSPNQTTIVKLIIDMQMYGVSQEKIDAAIQSISGKEGGFITSLKNRFRRNS